MSRVFERSPRFWWCIATLCGIWIAASFAFNAGGFWALLLIMTLLPWWLALPMFLVALFVVCRRPRSTPAADEPSEYRNTFPWRSPQRWLALTAICIVGVIYSWLAGVWVGGHQIDETCQLGHGQEYDDAYRSEHWQEPSRWFPLHNKCNADYDLVPFWVNPAIVILALAALGCLITAAMLIRSRLHGRQP